MLHKIHLRKQLLCVVNQRLGLTFTPLDISTLYAATVIHKELINGEGVDLRWRPGVTQRPRKEPNKERCVLRVGGGK